MHNIISANSGSSWVPNHQKLYKTGKKGSEEAGNAKAHARVLLNVAYLWHNSYA